MEIALIVVGILVGISSIIGNIFLYKALRVQLTKIEAYQNLLEESDEWTIKVRDVVNSTYIKMREIDDKGLFYKDDDVGFLFRDLLELIKVLNGRIEK